MNVVRVLRSIREMFAQVGALLILLFWAVGCGGGTEGTGIRRFQGNVRSAAQLPLVGVLVTLVDTGDATVTDNLGDFSVDSEASGENVRFRIQGDGFDAEFSLNEVPDDSSQVTVDIQVDTDSNAVEILNYAARVGMVGGCDRYFENNDIIRQANSVPQGTECTLKIRVYGDGAPAGNIPIGLERSACASSAPWETIATTSTGIGVNRGIAQITFPYFDTPDTCRYRVLLPFDVKNRRPLQFRISTFTEQAFEEKRRR